jgi:zinc and cadmium transporter
MFVNVLLASIAVSLLSLIGAFLLFRKGSLHSNYGGFLVSMAAGVMLATAVLDLLPEATQGAQGRGVYWAIVAGIAGFFILERFMIWFHHHDHDHAHVDEKPLVNPTAYLILAGDSFHNFFDGLALATAFAVNFNVGLAITFAVMFHEIPHELANFVALVHHGFSVKKALFYNLFSALPAIIGAVGGYYFLSLFEGSLPYLVGFNAGMFIYISCSDMIPALHETFRLERKWTQTITFLVGLLVMGGLTAYLNI